MKNPTEGTRVDVPQSPDPVSSSGRPAKVYGGLLAGDLFRNLQRSHRISNEPSAEDSIHWIWIRSRLPFPLLTLRATTVSLLVVNAEGA